MKCLYFWVKISIFIKNNPIFCNQTGKVFIFLVFIYLVLNLMLHYSTYIYPVVFTYKTCKNIFFFCLENWHLYIQVYFGKCMFCYFIDIRELSYCENDLNIVNISNGNSIYHVLWYQIKYWHSLKEGQVTLDHSPECLFKSLIYMSLLETDIALVNPWWGHFCPQSSIWSKFKYGPFTGWY